MNFVDLPEQYRRYKDEIHAEIEKVLSTAAFINGPAIGELEELLAARAGTKHAIACSSGTDALLLALMAKGIGPGDEVIVPDFTFIATAETVALLGARPVFADILSDTYNIDPDSIRNRITKRTVGIIPVSLYGQCADMAEINDIARDNSLWVLEDAAQSFGAEQGGRRSCNLSEIAATSFFPAKPLGAYGDGGAVFTSDDRIAATIRMTRNHGQEKRYHHSMVGINGRLDTLQAAVLLVKLRHFDEEIGQRRAIAERYTERLSQAVSTPTIRDGNRSVWAQYTIRTPERDAVAAYLKSFEIPTAIHYPFPLHLQKAFQELADEREQCPISLRASREVLSLPMHPFMSMEMVDSVSQRVVEATRRAA